jgi:hypothetical protein
MIGFLRSILFAAVTVLVALNGAHADGAKHRIVIQVDQNDPDVMNLALNNARNVLEAYRAKNQDVDVEVVAYGPGLHMLRDDTSPVKDRIKELSEVSFPSNTWCPPGWCGSWSSKNKVTATSSLEFVLRSQRRSFPASTQCIKRACTDLRRFACYAVSWTVH